METKNTWKEQQKEAPLEADLPIATASKGRGLFLSSLSETYLNSLIFRLQKQMQFKNGS